jgi:PKD repeat protein
MTARRALLLTMTFLVAVSTSGCHEFWCPLESTGEDWTLGLASGKTFSCNAVAEKPRANAVVDSTPAPAFVGRPVTVDGSRSTPSAGADHITSYTWNLDRDGRYDDATGPTATRIFGAPGDYEVALRVRDSDGRRGTVSAWVHVVEPGAHNPVAVLAASPTTVAAGGAVTFDPGGSHDPDGEIRSYEYLWASPGADHAFDLSSTGPGPQTHVYRDPGTYTARLRVVDDDGLSAAAFQTITVTESSSPTGPTAPGLAASFTIAPNPAPPGADVTFDASASSGNITAYEWDLDGEEGYERTTASPHTNRAYGEQYAGARITVRLRVANAAGDRSAPASRTLTVSQGLAHTTRPRGTLAAALGLRFRARLRGQTYGRHGGRVKVSRRRASVVRRAMIGTLRGSIGRGAGRARLAALVPATWIGRFSMTASRRARRLSVRGLVHAMFERAPGTACLRLRLKARGRRRTGTIVSVGGTVAGAEVGARARFRWRMTRSGDVLMRGRIRPTAAPGPPGRACAVLAKLRP